MITLTIDSQRCDLAESAVVEGIGCFDMGDMRDVGQLRNGLPPCRMTE